MTQFIVKVAGCATLLGYAATIAARRRWAPP